MKSKEELEKKEEEVIEGNDEDGEGNSLLDSEACVEVPIKRTQISEVEKLQSSAGEQQILRTEWKNADGLRRPRAKIAKEKRPSIDAGMIKKDKED